MYEPSTSCGEVGLILHNIFNEVFGYKENGIFIEVGANDGKTGSFTFNLGKLGWKGINCEPIPRLHALCCENTKTFKNVINLQTAIGEKETQMDIIDAGTLSTMDVKTLKLYLKTEWSKSHFKNPVKHKVNVERLDNVIKTHLTEEECKQIDLFVLDVEGFEEYVLKGFNIEKYAPKIIIIEISDQHQSFINNKDIMIKFKNLREYFKQQNYKLLVNDVVDNVYVRNDCENIEYLQKKFQSEVKYTQYNM
jgi:FkbM family methyltransferase